jgi:hypothetical protein
MRQSWQDAVCPQSADSVEKLDRCGGADGVIHFFC